jgi:hypothetical protein
MTNMELKFNVTIRIVPDEDCRDEQMTHRIGGPSFWVRDLRHDSHIKNPEITQ